MSQRRMMMNASNEKAKNLSKTLSTLLKYLKPFRIAIFFVILFAVGSTIFTIIGPKFRQCDHKASPRIDCQI